MSSTDSQDNPVTFSPPAPAQGPHAGATLPNLVGLMQRLLAPDGCPWDREQTLESLVPYLIEETYEVVDALAIRNVDDHCEELGDLLLQIVFQSELRRRENTFGIDDVVEGIVSKLVRRHPHVFGENHAQNSEEALASWARMKGIEKKKKGKLGALEGVPRSAPALLRAARLGEKASAVGFDWPDTQGPRDKISEETAELDEAIASGDRAAIVHELGDLLFAVVNLARKMGIDAEQSLGASNQRFSDRFRHVEIALEAQNKIMRDTPMSELDALWDDAKRAE